MEIHQVRYFLAVCEALNFTRAADRCHVAQPSLTRAIKKLEEELGGPLFRRGRAGTRLTDLGRMMKPHLEQVMAASESARAEAESFGALETAPVRLGVMCTIGPGLLVSFLDRLRRDIPAIELHLRDATGPQLIEAMLDGELDVSFIGMPGYPERLDAQALYSERYAVSFPRGHRFERMNAVPLKEMDGEDYLLRLNCELALQFEEFVGFSWPFHNDIPFQSEREDWIQCMIVAGLGCAFMPETMPVLPGIVRRLLIDPEIERTISLVTVAGRRFSPAVKILVALARTHSWKSITPA